MERNLKKIYILYCSREILQFHDSYLAHSKNRKEKPFLGYQHIKIGWKLWFSLPYANPVASADNLLLNPTSLPEIRQAGQDDTVCSCQSSIAAF